ncbi:hypothetical protein MY1884_003315 [Beauveria asiatica]
MEYLQHGDLQKHLAHPLSEQEAKLITTQIIEGLGFMHGNGFTHRDLKPGNIMVVNPGPKWSVKIADFGISKRRHELSTSLHTRAGTPGFAAPEAMGIIGAGRSYTSAVDMWSLGAVVYEIALSIQYARKTVRHATRTTIHHGLNGARWPAATDLDHGGQTFVDDPVQSSAAM